MMIERKRLVPTIRFKEFEDEWEKKKLGEVAKVERGRFSPRPRNNPIYYSGAIPFVQTSDVVNSNGRILNYTQTLNEKGLAVSKKFKKGSILITIAANIGYAGVLQIDMACPDSLIGLTCKESIYNYFLNYQLEIEQPRMDNLAVAAAQKNINIDFLKPYKISFPQLPEQQKIASFLTAIDSKLQQLNTKKSLLEQYKKGVMQQLFSQRLRFKDDNGRDYADWEEKTFGAVTKFINGKAYKQTELLSTGKYRVLRVGNLFSNNEWYYSDLELDEDKYIAKGDLIYAWSASFGPRFWEEEKVIYHYHIWKVIPNANVDKLFLFHAFDSDVEKIKSQSQGGTMFHITKGNIESRKFNFPPLKEQQKIANYLSAIDSKIESVNQQIEKTQAFKKGLLQGMFV
ncbi:MAG: restriction endonuclease subunit S [Aquaticitalea sp.]